MVAPTLSITSSKTLVSDAALITFAFSEDPGSSFELADVTLDGGTLGAIGGTGLKRTATFTVTPNLGLGTALIAVAAGLYTDAAGNLGAAGTTPVVKLDTIAPTLLISSSKAAVKKGETVLITFGFSEDPGTSFVSSDITLSGGVLSAIGGTGLTRSATFTPTLNLAAGTASITVADKLYTDAAGNAGASAGSPSISIDTIAPTLTITSDLNAVKKGETATLTFSFSEDPGSSFDASDISLTGGTLGPISGTDFTRTAVFTPTPSLASGLAGIAVAAGRYTDAAGNLGAAATTPVIKIDMVAPTLSITSSKALVKKGETATLSFSFSEDPGRSFGDDDIETLGGYLTSVSSTGLTRTATFIPGTDLVSVLASITVASGLYTDTAGNPGAAGRSPVVTVSTVGPKPLSVANGLAGEGLSSASAMKTIAERPSLPAAVSTPSIQAMALRQAALLDIQPRGLMRDRIELRTVVGDFGPPLGSSTQLLSSSSAFLDHALQSAKASASHPDWWISNLPDVMNRWHREAGPQDEIIDKPTPVDRDPAQAPQHISPVSVEVEPAGNAAAGEDTAASREALAASEVFGMGARFRSWVGRFEHWLDSQMLSPAQASAGSAPSSAQALDEREVVLDAREESSQV